MLDPYVILAPLFLLPVVGLLRYLGCSSFAAGTALNVVKIDPTSVTLKPGESKQFTALADGSPNPAISWSPNAPIGLFTAPVPFKNDSDTVTATYNGVNASAAVTLVPIVVTVTPPSVTLMPGQIQTFKALVDGIARTDVTWSPNAPGGVYQALGLGTSLVTATRSGATGSATVTIFQNAASFVLSDGATGGTWKGVYGNGGFALAAAPAEFINLPAGTGLNILPRNVFTFIDPTPDVRGLQKPPAFVDHFAAAWFDTNVLTLDFSFTDSKAHRVAIYFIDWTAQARAQRIDITDNSKVPAVALDTRTLSNFSGGQYLIWDLTGKVSMRITKTSGPNAVISGIFF